MGRETLDAGVAVEAAFVARQAVLTLVQARVVRQDVADALEALSSTKP